MLLDTGGVGRWGKRGWRGEREGGSTGKVVQGPVGPVDDLGSYLQGGGTQEGCGQRRGPGQGLLAMQ